MHDFRTVTDVRGVSSIRSANQRLMQTMAHLVVRSVVGPFVSRNTNKEWVSKALSYATDAQTPLR